MYDREAGGGGSSGEKKCQGNLNRSAQEVIKQYSEDEGYTECYALLFDFFFFSSLKNSAGDRGAADDAELLPAAPLA